MGKDDNRRSLKMRQRVAKLAKKVRTLVHAKATKLARKQKRS